MFIICIICFYVIFMYVFILYVYIFVYVYIYREREREIICLACVLMCLDRPCVRRGLGTYGQFSEFTMLLLLITMNNCCCYYVLLSLLMIIHNLLLRSVFKISCLFLRPRLWQF